MPSSANSLPKASRYRRRCAGLLTAILMLGAGTASAQAQDAGIVANACTSCHGVDGRSESAIPTIAGIDPVIFVQLMKSFRSDSLSVTIMNRIAKAYSDEQIDLLAAYFGAR